MTHILSEVGSGTSGSGVGSCYGTRCLGGGKDDVDGNYLTLSLPLSPVSLQSPCALVVVIKENGEVYMNANCKRLVGDAGKGGSASFLPLFFVVTEVHVTHTHNTHTFYQRTAMCMSQCVSQHECCSTFILVLLVVLTKLWFGIN